MNDGVKNDFLYICGSRYHFFLKSVAIEARSNFKRDVFSNGMNFNDSESAKGCNELLEVKNFLTCQIYAN